eukprot:TRINITY_DN106627_c0_g1_i1.p1 TRINITY_DN106627_c0_g1~~TRINITY_DN106627_c0_g1_i1.p1  ORF type:complete len:474 (+),score=34.21 TRINITY_DN106627_c0_g1_i1:59-1480(+)
MAETGVAAREPLASEPPRSKAFDPGPYALRIGWWKIFGLLAAVGVLLGLFSLGFGYVSTAVPKLWQGEAYETAIKQHDLGALVRSGQWWWILVGAVTGLVTGILRIALDYPMHVGGLMEHLAHQKTEWQDSWKTSILTLVSQMGGTSLGLEAGVAAAGCGFAQYIAEKLQFPEHIQKVCFTGSLSAVFGAMFPMPVIAPLMITEGSAAPPPGTKMSIFAINTFSSLTGYFIYVAVMGAPYLKTVDAKATGNVPEEDPDADVHTFGGFLLIVLMGILGASVVLILGTLVHGCTFLTRMARQKMSPNISNVVLCTLGGIIYGLIGFSCPLTLGTGHELIQPAVLHPDKIGTWVMFACLFAKMLSFAVVQAAGFEGGPLFCPITLGLFLGVFVHGLCAPTGMHVSAKIFAAAGMAGICGAAHTPFTNVVMALFLLQINGSLCWVPLLAALISHMLLVGFGLLSWTKMSNPLKAQLM